MGTACEKCKTKKTLRFDEKVLTVLCETRSPARIWFSTRQLHQGDKLTFYSQKNLDQEHSFSEREQGDKPKYQRLELRSVDQSFMKWNVWAQSLTVCKKKSWREMEEQVFEAFSEIWWRASFPPVVLGTLTKLMGSWTLKCPDRKPVIGNGFVFQDKNPKNNANAVTSNQQIKVWRWWTDLHYRGSPGPPGQRRNKRSLNVKNSGKSWKNPGPIYQDTTSESFRSLLGRGQDVLSTNRGHT